MSKRLMASDVLEKYGERVNYSEQQIRALHEGGHRIRHLKRISEVAHLYSIEAEVVKSHNCNSGHIVGQKLIMVSLCDLEEYGNG